MIAASDSAANGAYGLVLATRDRTHELGFWSSEHGFDPLFNATVSSGAEAGTFDVPIANDEPGWMALPAPLVAEDRP